MNKLLDAERKEVGRLESELREWSSVFGHFGESPDDIGNMINEDQDRLKAENKRLWEAEWLKAAVEFNRAPEDAEFGPGHFVFELASENDRLRAQLAQQTWISVTEQPPAVAQEVIVYSEFDGVCAGVLDSYGDWFAPCSEYKLTRVKLWTPLPPAPDAARLNSKQERHYPLPDDLYPGSKDWLAADYAGRVEWLHSMCEYSRQVVYELSAPQQQCKTCNGMRVVIDDHILPCPDCHPMCKGAKQ